MRCGSCDVKSRATLKRLLKYLQPEPGTRRRTLRTKGSKSQTRETRRARPAGHRITGHGSRVTARAHTLTVSLREVRRRTHTRRRSEKPVRAVCPPTRLPPTRARALRPRSHPHMCTPRLASAPWPPSALALRSLRAPPVPALSCASPPEPIRDFPMQ